MVSQSDLCSFQFRKAHKSIKDIRLLPNLNHKTQKEGDTILDMDSKIQNDHLTREENSPLIVEPNTNVLDQLLLK